MKLGALSVIGLGALALQIYASGCSDSQPAAAAPPAKIGKQPPSATGSATTSTDERTFAVDSLALGEATRAGVSDANAWKSMGFNLDNLVTTVDSKTSPDLAKVCKPVEGASATVHQDGDDGIDNTFAKTVLPLLKPFASNPSKTATDSLHAGSFTLLFELTGLSDDPAQTNTGLAGTLLVGAPFDPTTTDAAQKKLPTFTPADDWPYNKEPQAPLTGAYINRGVFVNGAGDATVAITLVIGGQPISFNVHRALISFTHKPGTPETETLEDGTIAGVIDTEEFVASISSVAGRIAPSLCSSSTTDNIKDQIRAASDIMSDGTQDPTKTCNGISVGIGFTAKRVGNPTKAVDSTPPPDPCH
jgi:hypothetical protein